MVRQQRMKMAAATPPTTMLSLLAEVALVLENLYSCKVVVSNSSGQLFQLFPHILLQLYQKFSASADGGPHYWVCAR